MKYLLILLLFLSLSLKAAFIPLNGTPFSGSIPLLEKGSLVTSNGDNNGEFDKCPDGEFLIWDDTEDEGMKCSGSLSYGPDIDATYTGILHMNKGTSSAAATGVFMYPDGGTGYDAYMYKNADNILYIGSSLSESIKFMADGSAMTINGNKSVTIHDTGGNGGNVLHGPCTVRSTSGAGGGGYLSVYCLASERITGGGCTVGSPDYAVYSGKPTISTTDYYTCQSFNTTTPKTSYAVCCLY